MPAPLDYMSGLLIMFLRCSSNCWVSGRKSSDGGWRRVKATHSASEVASFWSLALAAAERFKSPPGAREGYREIKKWMSLAVRGVVCRRVMEESEKMSHEKRKRGERGEAVGEFEAPDSSYLWDNPQSTASPLPSVPLQEQTQCGRSLEVP